MTLCRGSASGLSPAGNGGGAPNCPSAHESGSGARGVRHPLRRMPLPFHGRSALFAQRAQLAPWVCNGGFRSQACRAFRANGGPAPGSASIIQVELDGQQLSARCAPLRVRVWEPGRVVRPVSARRAAAPFASSPGGSVPAPAGRIGARAAPACSISLRRLTGRVLSDPAGRFYTHGHLHDPIRNEGGCRC